MTNLNKQYDLSRKIKEYEMKITKMAGYLSDYYIDRAMESDDFSAISSFLIDYFSGYVGQPYDVGYLYRKYKEYGLDEKVEDIDFNIDEWYKVKYELDKPTENFLDKETTNMTDEEYIKYMIEKRKSEQ
jgi:hypothetical protein